ncbi:glycosyltransferase family 2 protein [Deinococcus sp. QL22]|uniref:glycosyltransferase family 2 protein n=1 Tax=Deinococcus sp. QL22 TaxID=2939437 RepID=UPI002017A01B|nr:glycosyltransferase [Deinococcus sp. QL22]UQN07962.1 glycosyltransferase [Deinococcus sp. QL22]
MSELALSVVLPVRDQPFPLQITLEWLARSLPQASEVIVVDDGSALPAKHVAAAFEQRIKLTVLELPGLGRAAARNAGWRTARGVRVLFNDADRHPALSDLTPHLTGTGAVVGRHLEFYFSQPDQHSYALLNDFNRVRGKAREPIYPRLVRTMLFDEDGESRTGIPWAAFLTGNVSVERSRLADIGGFDEAFTSWGVEHFELGYRLHATGCPFRVASQAVNYHIAHSREPNFYQQHMRESMLYFQQKHRAPVLDVFARFLFGEVPMQDVERAAPHPGPWPTLHHEDVHFLGLRSQTLARTTSP